LSNERPSGPTTSWPEKSTTCNVIPIGPCRAPVSPRGCSAFARGFAANAGRPLNREEPHTICGGCTMPPQLDVAPANGVFPSGGMMPKVVRALVANAPHQVAVRERPLPPPGPDEVLLQSELSAIKHGTEAKIVSGVSPFNGHTLNEQTRLFDESSKPFYPQSLGNMTVGRVIAAGSNVREVKEGDR